LELLSGSFFLKKNVALSEAIRPSIAVLPFEDLSPEKDQEYLCVGLAESIINALTNIKNLRVPARTSSFSFKEKGENVREIGSKLDVKTVLEGSVQKSGDRLRVTAQLVNVSDESLLWSDQFNRKMEDVFAIQDEITKAIVTKLRVNLLGEERGDLVKRHTNDLQAYEA
jgi:TolB-like protein